MSAEQAVRKTAHDVRRAKKDLEDNTRRAEAYVHIYMDLISGKDRETLKEQGLPYEVEFLNLVHRYEEYYDE